MHRTLEKFGQTTVSIPFHEALTDDDVDSIIRIIIDSNHLRPGYTIGVSACRSENRSTRDECNGHPFANENNGDWG